MYLNVFKKPPGPSMLYQNYGHMNIEGYTDANWQVLRLTEDPQLVIVYLLEVI